MDDAATMAGAGLRVVLLRDGRWPDEPGVCCWRDGARRAFIAAGASVTPAVCHPAGAARSGPAPAVGPGRRAGWLPASVRAALVRSYRRVRPNAVPARRPAGIGFSGADLVIAESLGAAAVAAAAGVAPAQLWALALPAEWLPAGSTMGFGGDIAATADRVGGFLTDSELARESVERVLSGRRTRVELFPPLAADRPCAACAGAQLVGSGDAGGDPAVTLLRRWRAMLAAPVAPQPYTFLAARLRGPDAPWAPALRPPWREWEHTPPARDRATDPPGWSAAAQDRAAAAVIATVAPEPGPAGREPRAALVAGFDLKFAADLAERLGRRTDLDVTVDDWPSLGHGTDRTEQRLDRADAVFAEWARTSAVWLSHHKRPGQFLAVRLHRFELDARYPREIEMSNVDAVVYIAPLFGRRIRDELGWPVRKLVYIPNYIDVGWFDRPKLPEARFTLGFVGMEFARKRFDLALDLLVALRRADPRFTLAVRSARPWDNRYAWADPQERAYVGWCSERVERDPLLRGAVTFDDPGRDMARWYRRVGHLVSTSDEEGSHASVAEAMASGAVPVVRAWPGAEDIYDKEWVHFSMDAAAESVLTGADPDTWLPRSARARAEIRRTHDPDAVVRAWADLLHGDVPAARQHFAQFSDLGDTSPAAIDAQGRS